MCQRAPEQKGEHTGHLRRAGVADAGHVAQGARRCVDLPALYIHLEAVRGGAEQVEVYDQAVGSSRNCS